MNPVTIYFNTRAMINHRPPRGSAYEEPARIVGIEAYLKGHSPLEAIREWRKTGIVNIPICEESLWRCCKSIEVDAITDAEVVAEYGEKAVRRAIANTPYRGSRIDPACGDIYWSEGTWNAAKTAAGAAIAAADAFLTDAGVGHAFCIVRPPGHHCFDVPAGFCLLNNIVFAARRLLTAGKRVAIIDWDYHFGDGTAASLWGEENLMFVSFHAEKTAYGSPTYPMNTRRDFKGFGLAKSTQGRCFNIQWLIDNADDSAYAYAFQQLLLPALHQFHPDVILVSAGYDAIKGDALAGMELTSSAFRYMSAALATVGPIIAILEGGYDVSLLAEGVGETIQGLLQAPNDLSRWLSQLPKPEHREVVDEVCNYVLGSGKNLEG